MDCYNCRNSALETLPPRESIVRTQHWRVGHAFNVTLPGWLAGICGLYGVGRRQNPAMAGKCSAP